MLPNWIKRPIDRARIRDPSYAFLFDPWPADEVIAIDCETTGLNPKKDDIVAIAAIKIRDTRILTSERFEETVRPEAKMTAAAIKIHRLRERDVEGGRSMSEVLPDLLNFIGGRPLVGYYLSFDVAMLNKHVRRLVGVGLPNPLIEISSLYYERKFGTAQPGTQVDLSFGRILQDLQLPTLNQHDAFADALMTAMMYLALRDLKERGVRIERHRFEDGNPFHAG
jgi:DNA polymerase III subunit epsilon